MILDAVLADRSINWLGSERDKRRYFELRFGDKLRDNEYPRLVFGKPPDVTIRYFPDKLPIGYEPDRRRHAPSRRSRAPCSSISFDRGNPWKMPSLRPSAGVSATSA
jgi:hypothetical protein